MSSRLKKRLLRLVLAIAAVAALLIASVAFIFATESGTRWALGRVDAFAPIEIDVASASGTLLSVLNVPGIRYADEDITVLIRDIVLSVDWSACSFSDIAVEMMAVGQFSLLNTGDRPTQPTPLKVAMPAMPAGIHVGELTVASLLIGDLAVSTVSVSDLAVVEKSIKVSAARADIGAVSVDVNNLKATLDGDVPVTGHVAWRIADAPWSGEAIVGGSLRKLKVEHELAGDYPAHTEGTVELLLRTEPLADLVSVFDGWRYEDWMLADGSAHIVGTAGDYSATLGARVTNEQRSLTATISGDVAGHSSGLNSLDLKIDTPIAHARVSGNLDWAPAFGVELLLVTENLDPSSFVPVAAGAVNSEIRVSASSGSDFDVDIVSLAGTWNEQQANGLGRLARRADTWQCTGCLLNVGQNRFSVEGKLVENQLAGNIDISAPAMHQLWPGLTGSLIGDGRVQGTVILPRLSGQMAGRHLSFAGWQIESADVQTSDSTPENIDVRVEITGLAHGDTMLGSGGIQLAGAPAAVSVSTRWTMDQYGADLAAQFSLLDDEIDGRILSAKVSEPFTGTWTIVDPIEFGYEPGLAQMERGAWINGDAEFRHEQILITAESIAVDASLFNGPLSALNIALPKQVRTDGYADATIELVQENGRWSGNVDWTQRQTTVLFRSNRGDEILKTVPVAEASVSLKDNVVDLQATVSSDSGLQLSATASLTDLARDAPFEAAVRLNGEQWDWVPLIFPEIDNVEGSVAADIRAAGIASSPDLSGELRWQDGSLAMPALNLPLTGINITLNGTSTGDMTITGEALSGNGPLIVDGRLENITSSSPSFSVNISGDQADLLNWPDYRLTASPDLTFVGNTTGIDVSGSVNLDRAEIVVRELPEGAVSPSDDVTVVGREAATRERKRITGEVELSLSENVHIQAFGLDTNLEGQLQFSVPANGEPRAQGEVRLVGGVFEAYGQRLQIEQGTMVFTGPLDDPIINVRAIRKIDGIDGDVTAGIHLTGRAQNVSSTVFADPSMSEADALSYLLTGRPLADATTADGSNLSNTAYSLGLRQAALITNQIGQTVGLDELTVSGSNQNTTELVAGKQINADLYARYAYGVFTRLGHLLLRYRISQSFAIEIGAGETQSMDILYTIEKQ